MNWITKDTDSQNKLVINWLKKYGEITSIQAIRTYGITRLSARIYDLKRKGHDIGRVVIHKEENKSIHWVKYILHEK